MHEDLPSSTDTSMSIGIKSMPCRLMRPMMAFRGGAAEMWSTTGAQPARASWPRRWRKVSCEGMSFPARCRNMASPPNFPMSE